MCSSGKKEKSFPSQSCGEVPRANGKRVKAEALRSDSAERRKRLERNGCELIVSLLTVLESYLRLTFLVLRLLFR